MSEEEELEEMQEFSSLDPANAFLVEILPPRHFDLPKEVGRRIKEMRQYAGYSQRQLAHPGCSAAYISRMEAGDRTPSGQRLLKLAYALDTSPIYLALGAGKKHGCPGWVLYWLSGGNPVQQQFLLDALNETRHHRQNARAMVATAT